MQYLTKPRLILRPAKLSVAFVVASHRVASHHIALGSHAICAASDTPRRRSATHGRAPPSPSMRTTFPARGGQCHGKVTKFLYPSFPISSSIARRSQLVFGANCTFNVSRGSWAVANGRKVAKSLVRSGSGRCCACTTYGCVPRCGGMIRDGCSMSQG
jgi:hypothetical protein